MNTFEIFADSSANVPDKYVEKYAIKIIPYTCTVDGVERLCYVEGTNFSVTAKKFYEEMRRGADTKTSLVDEQRFIAAVTPCLEAGKDAVIVTIAAGISGTNHQANVAKAELEKKFPERKVYVLDSANASLGQGLQVLKIAEMREQGASAAECAKWQEENVYKLNSFVTVNDLKYLRKGGRVSTAAAIAGTILNIKPILWANGTSPAKLTVCGKERGRKKSFAAIVEAFKERVINPENQTIAIAHADCEDEALALAEMIKPLGAKNIIFEYYDLCTGSHAGPGTVALFFWGKDRRG